ncbi:MAG TPA: ZIP zinc transporter [Firmicutes bacterium]|nr:ZIP zinc transporter [Bacillota bacterium]
MNDYLFLALGIFIPFLETALGSAMVFFFKKGMNEKLHKILLGFASGVMVAASIWSLLIPSLEMADLEENLKWIPAFVGLLLGFGFLWLIDALTPHQHLESQEPEGLRSNLGKISMLLLAVTIHNIPEGMAPGIVLASAIGEGATISKMSALALSIGIAIQNFPEGAIISLPLLSEGKSKKKAFLLGTLSGAVEPIGAILMIVLASFLKPILPYFLSFASGAMLYVVVEELIPEAQNGKHSNLGTIGFAIGFAVMMVLDVALG